jgi:hypothetical protein
MAGYGILTPVPSPCGERGGVAESRYGDDGRGQGGPERMYTREQELATHADGVV